ncbi:MAG: zinc-dependent metalloprotease [Candidatus Nanopelagicales bacterium]|nr:zinc-dependent metalloprotease [Candidatus Nanopelagicales bacterium]
MPMIDWATAAGVGVRLAPAGPDVAADEANEAVAALTDAAARAVTPVREVTGLIADPSVHETAVVDRATWIRSNVDGLRVVLEPMEQRMLAQRPALAAGQLGAKASALELGAALSWLATKVLGQYEAFTPTGEAGRLLLVAPNIVAAEREMEVPAADFRMWVCVHEETHRVQFGAVSWLSDYFRSEIDVFLGGVDLDGAAALKRLGVVGLEVVRILAGDRRASIIDAVQTPAQREVFARLTALMSLVEGHAEWVMDSVGPEVIPSVAELRSKFNRRRSSPSAGEGLLRRLLGMDAKMRQYADGRIFVDRVVEMSGVEGFNQVWQSPQSLPRKAEIANPPAWVRRVLG